MSMWLLCSDLPTKQNFLLQMTDTPFIDNDTVMNEKSFLKKKKREWKKMLCPRIRSKMPYSAPYMTQEAQSLCLRVSVT